MNLLSNAVKFTEKGSIRVSVSGMRHPDEITSVSISVSDTGIGIPQNKRESIFDKFTQADSSITRRYGGSGLGLAITKALIDKMGGTIVIDSEPGIGSTFTVTIPFKNTQQLKSVMPVFNRQSSDMPRLHRNVLLVEDYQPNIMVTCAMLEQLGYTYDVAENGYEALRRFAQGHYDVILMDVQMHELDGMEVTRKIRRMEEEKGFSRTPIIAMTAHVREQDKHKCLESGMDDFIPKPFELTQLSQKILHYVPSKDISKAG